MNEQGLNLVTKWPINMTGCWIVTGEKREEIPWRATQTEDGWYFEPRGELMLKPGQWIAWEWTE